jgi:hypothetical protein
MKEPQASSFFSVRRRLKVTECRLTLQMKFVVGISNIGINYDIVLDCGQICPTVAAMADRICDRFPHGDLRHVDHSWFLVSRNVVLFGS